MVVAAAAFGQYRVWVLLVRDQLTHTLCPAVEASSWRDNDFAYSLTAIFIYDIFHVNDVYYDGDDDDHDMLIQVLCLHLHTCTHDDSD